MCGFFIDICIKIFGVNGVFIVLFDCLLFSFGVFFRIVFILKRVDW